MHIYGIYAAIKWSIPFRCKGQWNIIQLILLNWVIRLPSFSQGWQPDIVLNKYRFQEQEDKYKPLGEAWIRPGEERAMKKSRPFSRDFFDALSGSLPGCAVSHCRAVFRRTALLCNTAQCSASLSPPLLIYTNISNINAIFQIKSRKMSKKCLLHNR